MRFTWYLVASIIIIMKYVWIISECIKCIKQLRTRIRIRTNNTKSESDPSSREYILKYGDRGWVVRCGLLTRPLCFQCRQNNIRFKRIIATTVHGQLRLHWISTENFTKYKTKQKQHTKKGKENDSSDVTLYNSNDPLRDYCKQPCVRKLIYQQFRRLI